MIILKNHNKTRWKPLENAAKIFPPTSSDKDTKVFRFVVELHEKIDRRILQEALDITMESFPLYKVVLRGGAFWYYLEDTNERPIVEKENNSVCAPIYFPGEKNLLFRVSYYGKRINLEIHHTLSDGAGALGLLMTLLYHYLTIKYKEKFADNMPEKPYSPSLSHKSSDSFQKYYTGEKVLKKGRGERAYYVHGTRIEDNRSILIEGSMSVKAVLNEAHKYKTTLTGYLASLFIYSIYKEMAVRHQKKPIILSVPVNLRQFFKSESARNFFATINVEYNVSKQGDSLENIINAVNETFKNKLTAEEIGKQLNSLMTLENNKIIKIVPLPIKNLILRLADAYTEGGITAGISNIGRVEFTEELKSYINQMSVCTGARRPQLSVVSYDDNLTLSFTSPYTETEIQQNFFEFLANAGINIKIASNLEV